MTAVSISRAALAGEHKVVASSQDPVSVSRKIPVTITGFGDVISYFNSNDTGGSFDIGQAEVDLAAALRPGVKVEMAIAYDENAVHSADLL